MSEDILRQHIVALLRGGNAHMTFDQAIADFPLERINERFPNGPQTAWALLEHLRIAQWDILDFIRNPDYKYLEWPKDYWPDPDYQATEEDWRRTIDAFRADLQELERIALDSSIDLYSPIPHGTGQTILRELLLVADHNAYHIGEFGIMRRVMGAWPAGRTDHAPITGDQMTLDLPLR
jgi:uncharacterized damage-inducible protein DinB